MNKLIYDLSEQESIGFRRIDTLLVSDDGRISIPIADAFSGRHFDETVIHRHLPTFPLDKDGQGNAHVSFAFAAHRAVVDVDEELGLVRVVEVATSQDVGRVLNPVQARGQIEGGITQGLGLAILEEIILKDGIMDQEGIPAEILLNPKTKYVKDFVEDVNRARVIKAKHIMSEINGQDLSGAMPIDQDDFIDRFIDKVISDKPNNLVIQDKDKKNVGFLSTKKLSEILKR